MNSFQIIVRLAALYVVIWVCVMFWSAHVESKKPADRQDTFDVWAMASALFAAIIWVGLVALGFLFGILKINL